MKKRKIIGIVLAVVLCLAVPVIADSITYPGSVSSGGEGYSTSVQVRKSTEPGVPAQLQFTSFTNNDLFPSIHPLAARIRTPGLIEVTGTQSVYGIGTLSFPYYAGYGNYGDYYIARVASHSQSTGGANFTVKFTP